MTPTSTPLDLPDGYGDTTRTLPWPQIRAELEKARQYWLATVRVDGRPHVVPLDGLWVDDVWYYGGSPDSVHRRTALTHPAATMHLPDPWRVAEVLALHPRRVLARTSFPSDATRFAFED